MNFGERDEPPKPFKTKPFSTSNTQEWNFTGKEKKSNAISKERSKNDNNKTHHWGKITLSKRSASIKERAVDEKRCSLKKRVFDFVVRNTVTPGGNMGDI